MMPDSPRSLAAGDLYSKMMVSVSCTSCVPWYQSNSKERKEKTIDDKETCKQELQEKSQLAEFYSARAVNAPRSAKAAQRGEKVAYAGTPAATEATSIRCPAEQVVQATPATEVHLEKQTNSWASFTKSRGGPLSFPAFPPISSGFFSMSRSWPLYNITECDEKPETALPLQDSCYEPEPELPNELDMKVHGQGPTILQSRGVGNDFVKDLTAPRTQEAQILQRWGFGTGPATQTEDLSFSDDGISNIKINKTTAQQYLDEHGQQVEVKDSEEDDTSSKWNCYMTNVKENCAFDVDSGRLDKNVLESGKMTEAQASIQDAVNSNVNLKPWCAPENIKKLEITPFSTEDGCTERDQKLKAEAYNNNSASNALVVHQLQQPSPSTLCSHQLRNAYVLGGLRRLELKLGSAFDAPKPLPEAKPLCLTDQRPSDVQKLRAEAKPKCLTDQSQTQEVESPSRGSKRGGSRHRGKFGEKARRVTDEAEKAGAASGTGTTFQAPPPLSAQELNSKGQSVPSARSGSPAKQSPSHVKARIAQIEHATERAIPTPSRITNSPDGRLASKVAPVVVPNVYVPVRSAVPQYSNSNVARTRSGSPSVVKTRTAYAKSVAAMPFRNQKR